MVKMEVKVATSFCCPSAWASSKHTEEEAEGRGEAQACIGLGKSEWCQLVLVSMLSRDPDKCYTV